MGEEFYAIIKLVSGEEIMSLVMTDDNDGDPIIILQDPIIMKMVTSSQGSYIKVKPWMEMSDDDFFIVKLDKIITMTETKDKRMIGLYNNYINEDDNSIELYEPSGCVKPSPKMGYLSSVEDARKKLERIFNGIKEN
jgi:hypothetical protein